MKLAHRAFTAATAAAFALLGAAPAMAASDYLLRLDDIKDGVTTSTTVELASWSLGASNPTSIGSSGMSSGRRMHNPVRLEYPSADSGQVSVVTTARERGSGMATGRNACATGKHFPTAILTRRSEAWMLSDVTVSSCAADGMSFTYRTAQAVTATATQSADGRFSWNLKENVK